MFIQIHILDTYFMLIVQIQQFLTYKKSFYEASYNINTGGLAKVYYWNFLKKKILEKKFITDTIFFPQVA